LRNFLDAITSTGTSTITPSHRIQNYLSTIIPNLHNQVRIALARSYISNR
ncbi:hypothetical protein PMIN02_002701, partial [Paraphaeosphaeria minitans]